MKGIITLTTDFGAKDHYAGVMKGVILGIRPEVTIIDVTHEIEDFGVIEAAFRLKGFYSYFPEGTVHVVVVDPGVGGGRKAIAFESGGYFFVGPDNGIFSLIYGESPGLNVYEITNPDYMLPGVSGTFHGRDIFAPAAAYISSGVKPSELGAPEPSPVRLDIPAPDVTAGEIRGEVVYADSFGNLITNIPGRMLRPDSEVYVGDVALGRISSTYSDAGPGEPLALVGSSGLVEISVNRGSAARYLKASKAEVRVKL